MKNPIQLSTFARISTGTGWFAGGHIFNEDEASFVLYPRNPESARPGQSNQLFSMVYSGRVFHPAESGSKEPFNQRFNKLFTLWTMTHIQKT